MLEAYGPPYFFTPRKLPGGAARARVARLVALTAAAQRLRPPTTSVATPTRRSTTSSFCAFVAAHTIALLIAPCRRCSGESDVHTLMVIYWNLMTFYHVSALLSGDACRQQLPKSNRSTR